MKFTGPLSFLLIITKLVEAEDLVVRETKNGKVRGRVLQVLDVLVEAYKGIPFAEPPVGKIRFKPPVACSPWDGMYEATGDGTACPQIRIPFIAKDGVAYTEDCLHLNVWTPAPEMFARLPVFVSIHGGGFTHGSSASKIYDGAYLAAKSGHVVVSMNYRLGILGFLNADSPEAPGNVGLLDQHLALKWVQENVEAFGGDPEMVAIFGESAGGVSVHAHVLSPMSKGLFKRAIIMSGTANGIDFFDTVHESLRKGNDVAKMVGCSQRGKDLMSHPGDVLECLRLKPADELALASSEMAAPKIFPFLPTYHDQFLPKPPSVAVERKFFNDVHILAGTTSDEGALALMYPEMSEYLDIDSGEVEPDEIERSVHGAVDAWLKSENSDMLEYYQGRDPSGSAEALRRAYIDYLSDRMFNCPTQFLAEKHSTKRNSVYRYIFGHKTQMLMPYKWMGAAHGMDLPYFLASPDSFGSPFTDEDKAVSDDVVKVIASFSKNGIPELPNGASWKNYTLETPVSIFIGLNNFTEIRDFRKEECERWRKFF